MMRAGFFAAILKLVPALWTLVAISQWVVLSNLIYKIGGVQKKHKSVLDNKYNKSDRFSQIWKLLGYFC